MPIGISKSSRTRRAGPLLAVSCVSLGCLSLGLTLGLGSDALLEFLGQFAVDGRVDDIARLRWRLSSASGLSMLTALLLLLLSGSKASPDATGPGSISAGLIGIVTCWAYLAHRSGFSMSFLFGKEQLLELATAALYLCVCAFLMYAIFIRSEILRTHLERGLSVLLVAGCFVLGMEEISWGQTYLGFAGPDWLTALNEQDESNLHNLLTQNSLDRLTSIVIAIVAATITAMWHVLRHSASVRLRAYSPDRVLVFVALLAFFAAASLHLEVAEFLLSLLVAGYVFTIHGKLSSQLCT